MLCLSYALVTTWNRRRLPSSSIGMYPSSSTTRSLALPIWESSRSSLFSALARSSRMTSSAAVKNLVGTPSRQA